MNVLTATPTKNTRRAPRPFLTVRELADAAGVAPTTIYLWINQGLIDVERGGLSRKSPMRIPIAEANRVLSELSMPTVDADRAVTVQD